MLFSKVPKKEVTLDDIRAFINDTDTKRINFATSHINALRKAEEGQDCFAWLNLPFEETIEIVAREDLELSKVLFTSTNGKKYRRIDTEAEYIKIKNFIGKFKDLVFLRDTLDLSIALSMHETEPEVRTVLGEHEFRVKYRSDSQDISANLAALIAEMQRRLDELPYFKLADYICAVPSKKPFMREIIERMDGFGFNDISEQVRWNNKSDSLKDVDNSDEKLKMIQSWGLQFGEELDLNNKTVLLVDDMYQSGVTMQYIAMCMKDAGAKRVFGMALVKSLRN